MFAVLFVVLFMLVGLLFFTREMRRREEIRQSLYAIARVQDISELDEEPTKPYVVSRLRDTLDNETLTTIARSTRERH